MHSKLFYETFEGQYYSSTHAVEQYNAVCIVDSLFFYELYFLSTSIEYRTHNAVELFMESRIKDVHNIMSLLTLFTFRLGALVY